MCKVRSAEKCYFSNKCYLLAARLLLSEKGMCRAERCADAHIGFVRPTGAHSAPLFVRVWLQSALWEEHKLN